MSNWEKYLKDIYLDPTHPASFGVLIVNINLLKKKGNIRFLILK